MKKLVGLSSAELTLLPLARRSWVVGHHGGSVDWRESRFERTAFEREISPIY